MSQALVRRASNLLDRERDKDRGSRTTRRDFLGKTALVGSALTVAPLRFVLRPVSAYGAITDCPPGSLCSSDGYCELCCTINGGINACPAGTFC